MAKSSCYEKLQKVFMEFQDVNGDLLQYEQSSTTGEGLRSVMFPFNPACYTPDNISLKLFATEKVVETTEDYDFISYLVEAASSDGENGRNDYDIKYANSKALKDIDKGYFSFESELFPRMEYCDVTERDMFGCAPISSNDLKANKKGIWSYNGFRKFEITITGLPNTNASDFEPKVSFFWYTIDSTPINNLFVEEIRFQKDEKDENKAIFTAFIDTNALGEVLNKYKIEKKLPRFLGRFEVHNTFNDGERRVYSFPLEINVLNIDYLMRNSDKEYIDNGFVSIDFGTSSTCAAVKATGKNKLFTLSGEGKRQEGDNPYENPTNLMIYNWQEVYRQWEASNKNCPFVTTLVEEGQEKLADYDSGYTVDDVYQELDQPNGRRKMAAILRELKMIPYDLQQGKEVKFVPYYGDRSSITVVDKVGEEDGVKFNPIAFYGYILARAINNPANGIIYQKYQITHPTKFDEDVCAMLRDSLEYGIKRALPQPLRDGKDKKDKPWVSVNMDYSEPEACIGAIVGKQLKLKREAAKLFAIYDLGGGTMDFAFGMLREAVDDELDDADQVIEIMHIDGNEKIGGEKLIHQLAYKIYRQNKEVMEDNKIKFVLPEGEQYPQGFVGLLSTAGDDIANINLNIIKEKLARKLFKYAEDDYNLKFIFEGDEEVMDSEHYRVTLLNPHNEEIECVLEVSDVDEFLEDKIRNTIVAFKNSMEECFSSKSDLLAEYGIDDFDVHDVYIFLAGNASKQHYVREIMEEEDCFGPEQEISYIGEGLNDDELSYEYQVNCKTAVAFGQLNLNNYIVHRPNNGKPPFKFNVGYINTDDEFVKVLSKGEESTGWKKANRAGRETEQIALHYTTDPTCDRNYLVPLSHDVSDYIEARKLTVYLRVHDEDHIEFRLASQKEAPQDDEEVREDMLIALKEK